MIIVMIVMIVIIVMMIVMIVLTQVLAIRLSMSYDCDWDQQFWFHSFKDL